MAESNQAPFWQVKTLAEMSDDEWESLCDGCGKCCLHKLVDEDSSDQTLYYTDVRCGYLDPTSAQCGCYPERLNKVSACVNITLQDLPQIHFMPPSCAYRRLHEGHQLPSWHPLRHGGSKAAMERAGMAISNHSTRCETNTTDEEFELRIATWPLRFIP